MGRSVGPPAPWIVVAAWLTAGSLLSPPLGAQMGLRTIVLRGGPTDTLHLGRIDEVRLDGGGEVWMLSRPDSTEPPVAWRVDPRGGIRRVDGGVFPETRATWGPAPETWPAADPMPPDTVALVREPPSEPGPRSWVALGPDRFAWVDGPTGRVILYAREGSAAVRTDARTVPARRRAGVLDTELGLGKTGPAGAPGERVGRALADDRGRLWLLLGWSGSREEWAVIDPADAGLVEVIVLPEAYRLWAVRGERLVGVQRGSARDALHVLGLGET